MKQLALLLVAVALILGAWVAFGRLSQPVKGPAPLLLPENPADKMGLVRSAHQLWSATPGHFDDVAVVAFLRLLAETMDEGQWRAVCSPVFHAWRQQRGVLAVRPRLGELAPLLFPRLVREGSLDELTGLASVAREGGFDAAALNQELLRAVEAPMPATGFSGSRQEMLVAAAVKAEDYSRVQDYLAALKWPPAATPEDKAPLARLNRVLELEAGIRTGQPDLAGLARAWSEPGKDLLGRTAIRPAIESLLIGILTENAAKAAPAKLHATLVKTFEEPDALHLWHRIFQRLAPSLLKAGELQLAEVGDLARAYGEKFSRPGYEFDLWMRLGELQAATAPDDPTRATAFYERALRAAATDVQRVRVIKLVAAGHLRMGEFERAQTAVDGPAKAVKDPEALKELEPVLAEISKKTKDDAARVVQQEKDVELNRRQGRLFHMKELLARAKKENRPGVEIQAIEEALRALEREVTE